MAVDIVRGGTGADPLVFDAAGLAAAFAGEGLNCAFDACCFAPCAVAATDFAVVLTSVFFNGALAGGAFETLAATAVGFAAFPDFTSFASAADLPAAGALFDFAFPALGPDTLLIVRLP